MPIPATSISYPELYQALLDLRPACEIDLNIKGRACAMSDGVALWGGADDLFGVHLVLHPEGGGDWIQHRVAITYNGAETDFEQVLSDEMPCRMMAAVLVAMFETSIKFNPVNTPTK